MGLNKYFLYACNKKSAEKEVISIVEHLFNPIWVIIKIVLNGKSIPYSICKIHCHIEPFNSLKFRLRFFPKRLSKKRDNLKHV